MEAIQAELARLHATSKVLEVELAKQHNPAGEIAQSLKLQMLVCDARILGIQFALSHMEAR